MVNLRKLVDVQLEITNFHLNKDKYKTCLEHMIIISPLITFNNLDTKEQIIKYIKFNNNKINELIRINKCNENDEKLLESIVKNVHRIISIQNMNYSLKYVLNNIDDIIHIIKYCTVDNIRVSEFYSLTFFSKICIFNFNVKIIIGIVIHTEKNNIIIEIYKNNGNLTIYESSDLISSKFISDMINLQSEWIESASSERRSDNQYYFMSDDQNKIKVDIVSILNLLHINYMKDISIFKNLIWE